MESLLDEVPLIPLWGWLVIILIVSFLLFLLGYTRASRITGFGPHVVKRTETVDYSDVEAKDRAFEGKGQPQRLSITTETQTSRTLWEWLTVLTISTVIAVVALMYANSQAKQQRYIQDQQAKDDAVQAYLDEMTQMILDDEDPLLKAGSDSPERIVARVRTVTALKRLDAEHNKIVLAFLSESGLVNFGSPRDQSENVSILQLQNSELNDVSLAGNNLNGVNLRFARLRHADVHNATFAITNLTFADLNNANLKEADLRDAALLFANLDGANLAGANLSGARLHGADLSGANLKTAKNLTQDQIDQAGAGDSHTKLPENVDRPKWWSDPYNTIQGQSTGIPILRDSKLGASLVALKAVEPDLGDEIGIPKYAGATKQWKYPGALVYDVRPDSLADDAGLMPGDVITQWGPNLKMKTLNPVEKLQDLKNTLDGYPNEKQTRVVFLVRRDYFPEGWQLMYLDAKS
jgi:Pentapeptide repeats (8 copies)